MCKCVLKDNSTATPKKPYKKDNTSERRRRGKASTAYHIHKCPSGLVPEERARLVTAECAGSLEPAHLLHVGLLTRLAPPSRAGTPVQDFAAESSKKLCYCQSSDPT